jgi:hypothetical protein
MFTRAIFIRPDSEIIRESICACAKLFVDEESTWHKSNRGRTKTLTIQQQLSPKKINHFISVVRATKKKKKKKG